MTSSRASLLTFMRTYRFAVQSSVHLDGSPQSALVGVAVSDRFEIVFDTLGTSRKALNLRRFPRIALTIGGLEPALERTVQVEGIADEPAGSERDRLVSVYLNVFTDGQQRQDWPHLTYFRITPHWLRYSDYAVEPPAVTEFDADSLAGLK